MANGFASFVLLAWPLVVVMLFRSLPVPKALVISVVAGYLLLPIEPRYNLPLLPTYDKTTAALLPALLMAFLATRRGAARGDGDGAPDIPWQSGWLPRSVPLRICLLAILVGAMLTVLTNGDPVSYPLRTLPGLEFYDAGAAILTALVLLLPFLLARKFLARPEEQAMLLMVLGVAALAYSLPALWEVRMSPRLNVQIYGFFPHEWLQHVRGGFRPVVFLEHGLRLGMFLAIGVIALGVLWRCVRGTRRGLVLLGLVWLFATLVLSKNLSAFLIVCLFLPAAMVLRQRGQLLVAALFAAAILVYPMMRATGLVPIGTITTTLSGVFDIKRVESLNYRLENEDILLEKASERPLFGWGGWGRSRVYDEAGRDISTTDGTWIILFGQDGWIGYLGRFGLLTLPILLIALRRQREEIAFATSGLALILAGNLLDLLPNSSLTPLTWMMAGALAGRLETQETREMGTAEPQSARPPRYRREFPTADPAGRAARSGARSRTTPAAPSRTGGRSPGRTPS